MKLLSIIAIAACAILVSAAPHGTEVNNQANKVTNVDASVTKNTDVNFKDESKHKGDNEVVQVKDQSSNTQQKGGLNLKTGGINVLNDLSLFSNPRKTSVDSQYSDQNN